MKPVPAQHDAYGQQMWAFLVKGRSPVEVVERDDGFVSVAGSNASYFDDVRRWSGPERRAIRLARGRSALDVGCGAGRVALHLQARGFEVIAIDNSPLAVKTAKARGVTDARVLPFERVGQLPPDSLDTVVMFGNNFGLFGSRVRAKRLLKHLHRVTRDRAVLLTQSLDPHETREPAHLEVPATQSSSRTDAGADPDSHPLQRVGGTVVRLPARLAGGDVGDRRWDGMGSGPIPHGRQCTLRRRDPEDLISGRRSHGRSLCVVRARTNHRVIEGSHLHPL